MPFDPAVLRLMAITDALRDNPDDLVDRVTAAVSGGATCVQVRLKDASPRAIVEVTRAIVARVKVPVLVNDRFDIALAAGAAGVHLGADDVPVVEVRHLTPAGFVIGASVGEDSETANAALADYVGIGPIYRTDSKTDAGEAIGLAGFARLLAVVGKPAVGVGGITSATAQGVIQAGGVGIATIGAIFGTSDPAHAARKLSLAIQG